MSTTWKSPQGQKKQNAEEIEYSMSQELADLGMLEQGMTFQDKRDLLNVVRMSQRSAKVEEEERKLKTWSPGTLKDNTISEPTTSKEVEERAVTQNEVESTNTHKNVLGNAKTLKDQADLLNINRMSQSSGMDGNLSEECKLKTCTVPASLQYTNSSVPISRDAIQDQVVMQQKNECSTVDNYESQNTPPQTVMSVEGDSQNYQTSLSAPSEELFGGDSKTLRDANAHLKATLLQSNASNILENVNNKDSDAKSKEKDMEYASFNKIDLQKNDSQDPTENNEPENFIPSNVKQKDVNNLKRKKDDKERNIDVFSHSNCVDSQCFSRRNVNVNIDRAPFYFVPEGMNLRKYIAFFKCYVDQYFKNLAVIQRNNIEHLEWGPPITMESSTSFTTYRSNCVDAGDNSSKRYNFRDRCVKPKVIDFASDNSEDAEEESNDEDIFTPGVKKRPGIKLSTKRKNTSANDTMTTKKEKKDSSLKKVSEDGESIEENEHDNNNQTEEMIDNASVKNKGSFPCKRARKTRRNAFQPQNEISEEVNELVPSAPLSSIIEPDIVIAEGPSMIPPSQLDDITNQSSSLSVKQRRLQNANGRKVFRNRRKCEPRKNPEVVILEEEIKETLVETDEAVGCPICWQMFPVCEIEEHASECNQYNSDNLSAKP